MIPFKDTYYQNKVREFNDKCNIKNDFNLGDFSIEYIMFKAGRINAYMHVYKGDFYNYPILKEKEQLWMGVTPLEIGGCYEAIRRAQGKVGVIGLGLGYFVQEIVEKEKVQEIVVYEKSSEVIDFYNKNFSYNSKLKIINSDAFKAEKESFDFFFVDIYKNEICYDIVEDYLKLNNIFEIKEYAFWGLEHLILSCDSEDIAKVNLPEAWIAMADSLGDRFYQSKYKENFVALDYKLCKKLLEGFEQIFNN